MSLTKVSYAMIQGDPANVLDFGAVGDGTNDDTTAIQAAINSGKTHIYFPQGTYKITSNITIKQYMWIQGDGHNSIIFCNNCWFGAYGSLNGAVINHFKISDITFMSPNAYNGTTVYLAANSASYDVYRYELDNVLICKQDENPAGINYGTGLHMAGTYVASINNIQVRDQVYGLLVEKAPARDTAANAIVFTGGEFQSCDTGVYLFGANNVSFNGTTIEGATVQGVHVAGACQGVSFRDIYLEGNLKDFLVDSTTTGNPPNIGILFENIVTRIPVTNTTYSLELSNATGVSIDGYFVPPGGAALGITSIIGNTASSISTVIGKFRNVQDGYINQYRTLPLNTINPVGTPAINKETATFFNDERTVYGNDLTVTTNTAGVETTLRTLTIPANCLTVYGTPWRCTINGSVAATADAKAFKVYIGGSLQTTQTLVTTGVAYWKEIIEITPSATTSNLVQVSTTLICGSEVFCTQTQLSITSSASLAVAISATCASASMTANASYLQALR